VFPEPAAKRPDAGQMAGAPSLQPGDLPGGRAHPGRLHRHLVTPLPAHPV